LHDKPGFDIGRAIAHPAKVTESHKDWAPAQTPPARERVFAYPKPLSGFFAAQQVALRVFPLSLPQVSHDFLDLHSIIEYRKRLLAR
jgi:hypothetical protein